VRTEDDTPNPFFYVSSSEWNLYDDLVDFFRFNHLPEGSFLLNQVKRWYDLLKTGKTKHQGKLLRIVRIVEAFPQQRFILLGDNSQSDPYIYRSLAEKFGDRIVAVFIRSVVPKHDPIRKLSYKKYRNKVFQPNFQGQRYCISSCKNNVRLRGYQ
jgi:phosphatidate phosphatase APP1